MPISVHICTDSLYLFEDIFLSSFLTHVLLLIFSKYGEHFKKLDSFSFLVCPVSHNCPCSCCLTNSAKARTPNAVTVERLCFASSHRVHLFACAPKCTQHALPRLTLLTKIAWQITFLIAQLYFEFTRKPPLEKNDI